MSDGKARYAPWQETDEADDAVTASLDAATPSQLGGFIGELISISESRVAATGSEPSRALEDGE